MNQEKTTLEIIAPSIEEAVSKGLAQLGLSRDAVDVEVFVRVREGQHDVRRQPFDRTEVK